MSIKEKLENATPTTFFDDDVVKEHENAYRLGYNKAIDDFKELFVKTLEPFQTGFNMVSMANVNLFANRIADELKERFVEIVKAGGKND